MTRSGSSWVVCKDDDTLNQTALRIFFEAYRKSVDQGGFSTVLLSGGKTPEAIYSLLAGPSWQTKIDWNRVHLFWGDERFVPPENKESNFGVVRRLLISKISILPSNVHPIEIKTFSPEEAAQKYEDQLRTFFKLDGDSFPRFDLIFLGVGLDGHTASLFPGIAELREKKRWVVSPYIQKLKSQRISMTFPVLNQGRNIVVLAAGEQKAEILASIRQSGDTNLYPIQQVNPVDGKLTFLIDKKAASKMGGLNNSGSED